MRMQARLWQHAQHVQVAAAAGQLAHGRARRAGRPRRRLRYSIPAHVLAAIGGVAAGVRGCDADAGTRSHAAGVSRLSAGGPPTQCHTRWSRCACGGEGARSGSEAARRFHRAPRCSLRRRCQPGVRLPESERSSVRGSQVQALITLKLLCHGRACAQSARPRCCQAESRGVRQAAVRSPTFSKARACATFGATAMQAPDSTAAAAERAPRKQRPHKGAPRMRPSFRRSAAPRKPASAAAAGTTAGWAGDAASGSSALACDGMVPPSCAASRQQQAAVAGGSAGRAQRAASLEPAESSGSDQRPLSAGLGAPGLPGLLRFKAGAASGPWRAPAAPALESASGWSVHARHALRAAAEKENMPSAASAAGALCDPAAEAAAARPAALLARISAWAPLPALAQPAAPSMGARASPCTKAPLVQALGRMGGMLAQSAPGSRSAALAPATCPPLFCPPPLAVALHHAAPADGLLAAAAGGAASHDAGLAGVKGGRSAGSERSRALRPMMAPSACSARGRTVASLLPASSSPALAPVAPLADVTHAVANTPPDAAHGHSQGADSTATAVNAGVWA